MALPFAAAEKLPSSLPLLTVWGDSDNLAPSTGPVGSYFRQQAGVRASHRFEEIASCGHVPQDDKPDVTNRILREWLAAV